MNKRIKKLWIKALRSGRYKQGTGSLRINGAFCCLGVLCDLYRQTEGKGEWLGHVFKGAGAPDSLVLPGEVQKWAGLNRADPRLGPRIDSRVASNLNDNGKDFKYIADRIEKYL